MAKLNLQEKRRIENLVFGEIEESIRKFKNKRSDAYNELKESLIKNPPTPVKQLQEEIVKLESEIEAKKTGSLIAAVKAPTYCGAGSCQDMRKD
jgi:hypothetical protein